MTRILFFIAAVLLGGNAISQNTNLSDYSYVIVPEQFDFLNGKDKYKVNSMTKFYFDKNGFNAYMANDAPNANRCDGLYANVEELKSVFGTKLQIVLKDCKDNEIYRSHEGKSKYKEFDKTYQDALRKAFNSVEALRVNQKEVILISNAANDEVVSTETKQQIEMVALEKPKVLRISGNLLPDAKFSNYSNSGKTFLLRKTAEGYTLYEESTKAENGLLLLGKIIIMEQVVKYMNTVGKVSDASFDPSGNLTINDGETSVVYLSVN